MCHIVPSVPTPREEPSSGLERCPSTVSLERASVQSRIIADIGTVRWLYGLFLAIDANFRLKRKAVSNDNVDPSLSRGWGYFVEEDAYKGFLHDSADSIQEVS